MLLKSEVYEFVIILLTFKMHRMVTIIPRIGCARCGRPSS
jgi:hypothetical protein